MKTARFTEEQMVGMLREAYRSSVAEGAKKHGISEQTLYSWRNSVSEECRSRGPTEQAGPRDLPINRGCKSVVERSDLCILHQVSESRIVSGGWKVRTTLCSSLTQTGNGPFAFTQLDVNGGEMGQGYPWSR